jgi:acyl-CoA synthetase (AMP-forming)/AMP-acid ligase II
MSYRKLSDQAVAVAAALGEIDVRPGDLVLIMLPDGPDFVEAFAGVMQQGALPLSVNPLLSACDIAAVAAEAGVRLVLVSMDRIPALAGLEAKPPVLIDGPQGLWAAALRLREAEDSQAR